MEHKEDLLQKKII